MKPPRYLLREAVVRPLVRKLAPARALELGYGRGEMLLMLAAAGLQGVGFDPSAGARSHAQQRLDAEGVNDFKLVDAYPHRDQFDIVMFFEVIGYIDDPVAWLSGHKQILNPGGQIIFSFTNSRHQGIAEQMSGQMRCFSRNEMQMIVTQAGYRVERMINYGYPLANLLRWVRALIYAGHITTEAPQDQCQQQVESSGFVSSKRWVRAGIAVFNSGLILPFVWLQSLFHNTSAGTGFVVVASLGQD